MIRCSCSITNLELEPSWAAHVGPSINAVAPSGYEIVRLPNALSLYCCGPAYAGWLANHVDPFLAPFTSITFSYEVTIDEATLVCAQVIETDFKFTDAEGYTYDGSAQWNIAEGWMFQIDNEEWTWVDTGVKIPPMRPGVPTTVQIKATVDYKAKKLSMIFVTVDGVVYPIPSNLPHPPAKKCGWEPMKIVTQLQQCTNGHEGAYSLKFKEIGYEMTM